MKVLFLTQLFDPTHGGVEMVFNLTAEELARRGHSVYVVCQKVRDNQISKKLPLNLKIYDVKPEIEYSGGLPFGVGQSVLYIFNVIRCGLNIIKSENIDIIHASTYLPVFAGAILSRLTGKPLVVTVHDVALVNGLSFWKNWMRQFKAPRLYSFLGYAIELLTIYCPADVIVTVSEASRNDILSVRKNAPIVVIPNGLATYSYMRNSSVTYNDKVVFIGRAIYYKNLEVVLNALKFVVQRKPEAELIVIGTGPMRSLWEKLVTKYGICSNVTFKGHVSEEEKVKILSEATCLVLPSLWEGFGVVVLEAWALKKPVIVAKVKPLSDIVTHEKDGFHLDPFNPLEWAKHLQMLLQDKNLARRMGEAGYDKLVKNFTIQNSVDKLENLYIKLDNLQKSFSIPSAGKDTD